MATSSGRAVRVLMIGLDAAEPTLIEKWMDSGYLPNLRRLRAGGCYGRLTSPAKWLPASPWPTFFTGTTPAEHGYYYHLQWRPELMTLTRPSADWLPMRPFWRQPSFADRRVIALDVPLTYAPERFNGVEICGLGTHDHLGSMITYPHDMLEWVRREFGSERLSDENHCPEAGKSLLQHRDELIRVTERAADVAQAIMKREDWDLFMIVLGATHRGGHKLWDLSAVRGEMPPDQKEAFSHALRDVYVACDAAVGRLVEAAGPGVRLLVFSLHGMGPNTSRVTLLPDMLKRILGREQTSVSSSTKPGLLKRFRGLVPIEVRDAVKRRLPPLVQEKLSSYWQFSDVNFSATSAFSLASDLRGYIRINLNGREASGMVEPGDAYDRLCAEIGEGLGSFFDADTRKPIVEEVTRTDRVYHSGGRLDYLPDLLVRWSAGPASKLRAATSRRHGTILWPTPGLNPDGRSGNHRGEGFLVAWGGSIPPNSTIEGGDILDLAPTVCTMLGLAGRPDWQGKVLLPV